MDLNSRASAAVEAIYDTVLDSEAWPAALRAVRRATGSAGGRAFLFDARDRTLPFCVSENLNVSADAEWERHLQHIDPRLGPGLADPPGLPMWDHRVITESEMDRHEFYDAIERLAGVRYFIGVRPFVVDGRSLMTTVVRSRRQGHAEEAEIALFAVLAQHIGHAFRLASDSARDGLDATLLQLVDRSRPEAVFLLDGKARLLEANAEAQRILALDDGLRLDDGVLQPWKSADGRALSALIAGALDTVAQEAPGSGGVMALPRPSGALPFLLRVMPWPHGKADPFRRPSAVVLLRDPQRRSATSEDELTTLLGLTEREAALALRVASGESLQAAAAGLGISYNTARVHLRNIFEKTGAASQRDLQRLVLAAP